MSGIPGSPLDEGKKRRRGQFYLLRTKNEELKRWIADLEMDVKERDAELDLWKDKYKMDVRERDEELGLWKHEYTKLEAKCAELEAKHTELEAEHTEPEVQCAEPEVKCVEPEVQYTEPDAEYMEVVEMVKRERRRERRMKEHQAAIVACILFKAIYAIATWEIPKKGTRLEMIASLQERPERFGCQTPEQVDEFAEAVRFPLLKLYLTYNT